MFTAFLERHIPASTIAKPAFMKITKIELIPESKSVLVLCITRKDACYFSPGDDADPLYGSLFRESLSAGMITIPCSFEFHKDHVSWKGIKPLK